MKWLMGKCVLFLYRRSSPIDIRDRGKAHQCDKKRIGELDVGYICNSF